MFTLLTGPSALAETIEGRVGKTYWARPALSDTSVEFYVDMALRERLPIYGKQRFEILGVRLGGPWPPSEPVYALKFDDGRRAFIDGRDFERRLYRELRPNEVSVSPGFDPPLGRGVQVLQFERASIFVADPDVMWERVRNQGPRSFQSAPAAPVPRAAVPPVVTPESPVAPTISPR